MRARDPKSGRYTTDHGHTSRMRPNGSPEYRSWRAMIQRCDDPHAIGYARYGGRGIVVCGRWRDFRSFLSDMGPRPSPRHSLDRVDNDGPYAPGNVRWATSAEQNRHQSSTKLSEHTVMAIRVMVTYCLYKQSDVARAFGVHRSQVSRILSGKRWANAPVGAAQGA